MKVLFSPSFLKDLNKIRSINRKDILNLLKKYPHTKGIMKIDSFEKNEVLKCYLLKKKVRALVLLNKVKQIFVPISVIKKETHKGKNISKETYIDLFYQDISKIMKEIDNDDYEVIEVKGIYEEN